MSRGNFACFLYRPVHTWDAGEQPLTPPKKLVLPDHREQPTTIINQLIRTKWQAEKIAPARRSSDTTFVRRVYLDLLGRIPRLPEINSFLADQNPKKRSHLVDQLTTTDDHADHLAQVGGKGVVALGSDFDGLIKKPEGLPDASAIPALCFPGHAYWPPAA